MNIEEKAYYRNWAKDIRKTLDLKKVSCVIEGKIKDLDSYKSAKTVMSYMAKDIEVSFHGLFDDKSKEWFLPVVGALPAKGEARQGRHGMPLLVVSYIPERTKLVKRKFNILEPEISNEKYFEQTNKKIKLDLIFVPGLCFDKKGSRIGFGMGFYDAFLKLNPNTFKIGTCPKDCLVDSLPRDMWDECVDLVITD